MRFRLMATYRGVPYEVGVGPSSSDVVLFAACPPPEELGFEPAPGHWRKQVIRAEVDVLWESRPVGSFHGDPGWGSVDWGAGCTSPTSAGAPAGPGNSVSGRSTAACTSC